MSLSRQQIRDAFKTLPGPIREFVSSPDFGDVMENMSRRHGLHIDTAGKVGDASTRMLIGLLSPVQFVTELKAAGLPDATASAILQDLNERVFKPLHEKVREEKTPTLTPPTTVSTTSVSPPAPRPPQPPPTPRPAPPPIMPPPAPKPVATVPPPIPPPIVPPAIPPMRTMAHDVESMKEGKVPTPTPSHPVPPPPPAPTLPRVPQEAPASIPTHEEVSTTLKQYGIDPYREPLE
jgi:hypothetical protein